MPPQGGGEGLGCCKSRGWASGVSHEVAPAVGVMDAMPPSCLQPDQARSHLLYSDTGSQSLASGKQNWGMALSLSSASRICLVGRSSCRERNMGRDRREKTWILGGAGC